MNEFVNNRIAELAGRINRRRRFSAHSDGSVFLNSTEEQVGWWVYQTMNEGCIRYSTGIAPDEMAELICLLLNKELGTL